MALIHITKDNFESEVTNSEIPVLLDFYADWCGPCRALGPTLEALATEWEGRAKIAKLNVDKEPELAGSFQVRGIPTMIIFKSGNELGRLVGDTPKNELEAALEKAIV